MVNVIDSAKAVGLTESVTYTPAGGTARTIDAIVRRSGDTATLGRTPRWTVQITVKNSSTAGIAASALDTGGDRVAVSERLGAAASERRIVKLVEQTPHVVILGVA